MSEEKTSTIVELDAAVWKARAEFGYGTVHLDGKVYRMSEPWWHVADRAAAKYGTAPDAGEPLRYARAKEIAGAKP